MKKNQQLRLRPCRSDVVTLVAFLFLSLPLAGQAQTPAPALVTDPQTLLGPQSIGRGGATAAASLTHDALFQNPATAAFDSKYAVNLVYLGTGDALAASIVDTKSGPVGGGLYYLKREFREAPATDSPSGSYARSEERAGVSLFSKFNPSIAFGATVKYAYRRSFTDGIANTKAFNFDVGARFLLSTEVSAGVVAENMMSDTTGLNPKAFVGGFEFRALSALMLSAQVGRIVDPALPDAGPNFAAGAEYLLPYNLALRAGYRDLGIAKQKYFTAGLGWDGPSFGANYSIQSGFGGAKGQIHSFGFSGYL